jgi:hypothetical protein
MIQRATIAVKEYNDALVACSSYRYGCVQQNY